MNLKKIIFLDSKRKPLFTVKDNGKIKITVPGNIENTFIVKIIDSCHFNLINYNGYNQGCYETGEFAETMAKVGNVYEKY